MNNKTNNEWEKIIYRTEFEKWGLDRVKNSSYKLIKTDEMKAHEKELKKANAVIESQAVQLAHMIGSSRIYGCVLICLLSRMSEVQKQNIFKGKTNSPEYNQICSSLGRIKLDKINLIVDRVQNRINNGNLIKGTSFMQDCYDAPLAKNYFIINFRDGILEFNKLKTSRCWK